MIAQRWPLIKAQEQFFRAGHGHAGVLLVMALVFFVLMDRTRYQSRTQLWLGITLLAGILVQSGGFFLHMLIGDEGAVSAGTWATRSGAVLLAIALISLGIGLLRASGVEAETS